jgi:replicative DNA helicase
VAAKRRRERDGGASAEQTALNPRAIPADHEAERAVLGAILLDHEALYKVQDKLNAQSFDLPRHRILYESYLALIERQQAITLISLRNYLQEQDVLEKVGGVGFLAEVADAVPTAAHIETHAMVLREKGLARALIRTCEEIAYTGYQGSEPAAELLERAERDVLSIAMGNISGRFADLESEIPGTMQYIRRVQAGEITGVPTGFTDLDDMTGGFEGGDLVVLAARPSMGKTAFALNIARNVARNGGCVAIFSLEMTTRQLVLRMLMAEAQLDLKRFHKGVLGERDMRSLANAAQELEGAKIFIDDSGLVSMTDITAKSRRLDREQKLTFMVVDYIQLISSRSQRDRNREQEVAEVSRTLKLLAKELDIPILALSQLSRKPEERADKRPMLSDLRESGAIEQDADRVMFIYRDEFYDENSADLGVAELILAKQRNGPTGKVRLKFDKEYARFGNLARDGQQPPDSGFGLDAEPPF